MAHDDRYSDRDRYPTRDNDRDWRGDRSWRSEDGHGRDDDRGFFERVGDWFSGDDRDEDRSSYGRRGEQDYDRGYGRDRSDRSPGSHADYYRGGDRGQRRMGPGGGFEMREDYRRTDRYSEQGNAGRGRYADDDDRGESFGGATERAYRGGGGYGASTSNPDIGIGGLGVAPEFGDGPRFDRQDIGSVGTHGAHPVSSRFGESQRDYVGGRGVGPASGGSSSARSRAILDQAEQSRDRGHRQSRSEHDPHYSEWRRRQIESLDRDYDEYRRENASRFESEFGSWRERRGEQRQSMGRVREHMEVVGSDGQHVGTVDKVRGDRIILTKSDPNAGGHHHSIPCSWLESVDDKVTISKTAEQAMNAWRDEERNRALFERHDSGTEGPHILDRSFSGTYREEH
jgi:hypothetical protein